MDANSRLVLYFAIFFILAFTRASGNIVRNGVENDSKLFLNRANRNDWSQLSMESKSRQLDTITSSSKYTLDEAELEEHRQLDIIRQFLKKRRQHIGKRYTMN